MAQYTVQAPDGQTITLEGPEGASQAEVIAQAQKLYTAPVKEPVYPTEEARQAAEARQTVVGRQAGRRAVVQPITPLEAVAGDVFKGAVLNPALAVAQVVGGQKARDYASGIEQQQQAARKEAGLEGVALGELAGAIISPVNRLIPAGSTGIVGRGALGGVVGSILNPVTGENLSLEDVVAGKVEQAGLGAIVGRLGAGIAGALTPTLKTGTRELMESGVPVTPGQAYEGAWGGLFRQIEKLDLPGMRVNKEAINKNFTTSIGNEVLSSIDDTLPANIKNGQQAFGYIQDKISKYYDSSLLKIGTVKVDDEFQTGLKDAVLSVKESVGGKTGKEIENFVNANVIQRLKNGTIDGTELKKVEEVFRKKIDSVKGFDRPAEVLKTGYDDAYKAVKAFILRNDADGSIAKANEAYMKRARFLEAVNKNVAEIQGGQGNFSPAQLAQVAAKQGTPSQAARGAAPLQPEANRALNVVGDTTDEAQKFRNVMIAGKLTGLGALGLFSPTIALPILTASGMSYAAAKALMQDPGATRLAVQKALQDNPQLLGNIASQQGLFGAGQR
jgi:hypothetical protein